MLKYLWRHFVRTVVKDQRGIAPWIIPAGISTIGAGISLFGGKKKQTQQQDFIADIRRRLEGLAEEVPGLVEKRKQLLREQFGVAEEAGLEDIAGEFRAERGFGELSTMEVNRRAMLRERLKRALAGEELGVEEAGLRTRMGLTERLGGLQIPEEEPGFGEQLLGFGGELLGGELRARRLKGLLKEPEGEGFRREIGEIPTTITAEPELTFEEFQRFRRRR